MGKAPAFQLYASDFYMDTAAWEVEEVGAYMRLLLYEWVNGGVPDDMEQIARIVGQGLPEKSKRYAVNFERKLCDFGVKMRRNVLQKFHLNGNGLLVNSRLETEREKQSKYIESQSQKGKKSAELRVNRGSTVVQPELQPEVNSSSSFSSSSSLKNKEKIKHIAKHEASPDVKPFIDFYFQEFKSHFEKDPVIQGGKDGSIIKSLLKTIPLDELKTLLCKMFDSEDPFIVGSGYTLGVFKSQINKLRIGDHKQSGLKSWAQEIMEEENGSRQEAVFGVVGVDGPSVQRGNVKGES